MRFYPYKKDYKEIINELSNLENNTINEKYNITNKFHKAFQVNLGINVLNDDLLSTIDNIRESMREDERQLLDGVFAKDDSCMKPFKMDDYNVLDNIKEDFWGDARKGKMPVYFFFNDSGAAISTMIMRATDSDFSHLSISVLGVSELVSFATSYRSGKLGGLVTESFYELLTVRKPLHIGVYAILVDIDQYVKLLESIEYFKKRTSSFRYSWKKLVLYPFIPKQTMATYTVTPEFYCSEFVGWLVHNAGINKNLEGNKFINIPPSEYEIQLKNSDSVTVFKGKPKNFKMKDFEAFEKRINPNMKNVRTKLLKLATSNLEENDDIMRSKFS